MRLPLIVLSGAKENDRARFDYGAKGMETVVEPIKMTLKYSGFKCKTDTKRSFFLRDQMSA